MAQRVERPHPPAETPCRDPLPVHLAQSRDLLFVLSPRFLWHPEQFSGHGCSTGTNRCSGSQRFCPPGSGVPPWWAAPQDLPAEAGTPAGTPAWPLPPSSLQSLCSLCMQLLWPEPRVPQETLWLRKVPRGSLPFHRPKAPIRVHPWCGQCEGPRGPCPQHPAKGGQAQEEVPPPPNKDSGPSTELQGLDTLKGRPGRNRAPESAGQERASGHGSASLAPSGCGPGSRDSRSESRGPVGRSCLG